MAALQPVVGDQSSAMFDFHDIGDMGPYPAILRAHARVPPYSGPSAVVPTTTFDVGDLRGNMSSSGVRYEVKINGGRSGTPGLEVTFSVARPSQPPESVVLFFEPGVLAGQTGGLQKPVNIYNLGTVHEVKFLGQVGGGGHLYQHDPPIVGNDPGLLAPAAMQLKQRTVRMIVTTNGLVTDDPVAFDRIKAVLPAMSRDRRFLDSSGSRNFGWRVYFFVPVGMRPTYEATVISPFRKMCTADARAKPYHHLTTPPDAVNLDMERIDRFRRHMIRTSTLAGGIRTYGPPNLLLAGTQGRRDIDRYSAVARLGHVRENQAFEEFCGDHLRNEYPSMKVVRTYHPVLSKILQSAPPSAQRLTDQYIYLGHVQFDQPKRFLPCPGSIFQVKWCVKLAHESTYWFTGSFAFGMMLDLPLVPTIVNNSFILALGLAPNLIQQYAATSIAAAPVHSVHLEHVQNRLSEQVQLNAMVQLARTTVNPNVLSLRAGVLRSITSSTVVDDIRYGPLPPRNDPRTMAALLQSYAQAVNQLAGSTVMEDMAENERRLLMNGPGHVKDHCQAIQVGLQSRAMRSVYATMLALLINGHRFVVVVDDAADRCRAVHDFHDFLRLARTTGGESHRRIWDSKIALHWTTVDMQTAAGPVDVDASTLPLNDARNPARQLPALVFKHMMDTLPEHDFCLDQNGSYFNAPADAAPRYHTPLEASLGSVLRGFFVARPVEGFRFFQDQAETLNTSASHTHIREKLERYAAIMKELLPEVHVLFTNSKTAMTDSVRTAFPRAILVLGNTHRMVVPQAVGVMMAFPDHSASLLLGSPNDQRPVLLASQGRNEASITYNRMFWQTAQYAGLRHLTLP